MKKWRSRRKDDLPIKVGVVTPGLAVGGAERWVQTLISHLDPKVLQPTVVILSNPRSSTDTSLAAAIRYACPVLRLSDDCTPLFGCDLVVLWGAGRLPKAVEGFSGTVIYTHHASTDRSRAMARQAASNAQHIVAVSESAAAFCGGGRGCAVIRNGVDLSRLSKRRVNHGDPTILYVGRANSDKRPDLAARAAAFLGPPWRVRFVGGFAAQQRRELSGLCERVEFSGVVDEVGDHLATADVLLLASRHEAMSLTLLEAWAAGLPTVTTPVGAVLELERDHGQMTIRIPVDAGPEAAAAAILEAICPYNAGTVARARAVVEQHYSAQAMVRRWTTFLFAAAQHDRVA